MKLLKSHNDELKKLYGNKVDMIKRILNMFQTKTIVGLQNIALKKLKKNNREEIQKNKIMNALLKSTVFQMNEMLQRLKEHRLKCIFDEKISDSVRQRIINNLCKNQERKLFELMRAGYIILRENMKGINKKEKILAKFIINSITGQMI